MLMISPLDWIEAILSSSKEEIVLVLLKYQNLFIEYTFLSPASYSFLVWAHKFSTIQWIVNFHTSPYSSNGLS